MVDSMAHMASCAWFILMILCMFYECVMYFFWFSKGLNHDGTEILCFSYPDHASFKTDCTKSFHVYVPNIIPCFSRNNQSPFQVRLREGIWSVNTHLLLWLSTPYLCFTPLWWTRPLAVYQENFCQIWLCGLAIRDCFWPPGPCSRFNGQV